MKGITMQDRFLLRGYMYKSLLSGWKYICQSNSHLSKLLRSSCLSQFEELWIAKYRRILSAKNRTVLLKTYSKGHLYK